MSGRRPVGMPAGTIHRSIHLLADALDRLGARIPLGEVEALAVMINQAMTVQTRSFHTPEHVFDLVDPDNPHTTLAALFHDLVYHNVDQGFIPRIEVEMGSSIESRGGGLGIRAGTETGDRQLALCMGVFGFASGSALSPFGGMNEFLSALVMNRGLGGIVREKDLILSTACIEATIPFRKPDADGTTPAEHLARRLERTNRDMGLGLGRGRIEEGVRWAVSFANRDVANFSDRDVARFLDNTWKLLPETNPSLRTHGVFSIKSYRVALDRMAGFLESLDPETIFAHYKGAPPQDELRRMRKRGERNVGTARAYLGIKVLTAAILEALAEMSGGDAPMSLFMGDIGDRRKGSSLADHLPVGPAADAGLDATLHGLLAHGRASASSFDLQNSPLSLFIYRHLGDDGFRDRLGDARRMFAGALSPKGFLATLPGGMVAAIAEGCARMAFTRSRELCAYAATRRGRVRPPPARRAIRA